MNNLWVLVFIICFSSMASANLELESLCRKEVTQLIPLNVQAGFWWPREIEKGTEKFAGWHHLDFATQNIYEYASVKNRALVTVTSLKEKQGTIYDLRGPDCKIQKQAYAKAQSHFEPLENTFTDTDLVNLVQSRPKSWGVIYVWTIGMPLAVRGLAEIRKAMQAQNTKGELTIIYEPSGLNHDLPAIVKLDPLAAKNLHALASDELMGRGFGLHYPSAIFYSNGKLSPRTYKGYKTAAVYGRWMVLEARLLNKDAL